MEISTVSANIKLEDGILIVRVQPLIKQTLEMAQENLLATAKVCQGIKRPMMLDIKKAEPLQSDIRRYYSSSEAINQYLVIGVLVKASPFGVALGNFYLNMSKTVIPKKLFTKELDCLSWLKKIKNQ